MRHVCVFSMFFGLSFRISLEYIGVSTHILSLPGRLLSVSTMIESSVDLKFYALQCARPGNGAGPLALYVAILQRVMPCEESNQYLFNSAPVTPSQARPWLESWTCLDQCLEPKASGRIEYLKGKLNHKAPLWNEEFRQQKPASSPATCFSITVGLQSGQRWWGPRSGLRELRLPCRDRAHRDGSPVARI